MTVENKPLVSFVLLAYEQEKFIREAVEGAFAQTYSPLEIILSDDCSHDKTFEIMQEMATSYLGPHTIILNKNESNLGIGYHINKAFSISKGFFIVAGAGDDISLPQRVEKSAEALIKNKEWMSVTGSVELFGRKTGYKPTRYPNRKESLLELCMCGSRPRGCSTTYRRELFDNFNLLSSDCAAEDIAYSFRASLLGIAGSIDDLVVKYRIHNESESNCLTKSKKENAKRSYSLKFHGLKQNINDFIYFSNKMKKSYLMPNTMLHLRLKIMKSILYSDSYYLYIIAEKTIYILGRLAGRLQNTIAKL